ncbi:MAG: hypothetical protein Q8M98_03615 [Candidatus Cloacimonadaceae bacterium]|nr:hypothetical protein [Candidatus Cloacimonadaceae bacterium]
MENALSSIIASIDAQRAHISRGVRLLQRENYGQYFTPHIISSFMASFFPVPIEKPKKLLDPGAGIGGLSCAFVMNILERSPQSSIQVDCFEIDDLLIPTLSGNLHSINLSAKVNYSIFNVDFVKSAVNEILSFEKPIYTHAILNPPYMKIHSNSEYSRLMSAIDIEVVNLYSAFVSLSVELGLWITVIL